MQGIFNAFHQFALTNVSLDSALDKLITNWSKYLRFLCEKKMKWTSWDCLRKFTLYGKWLLHQTMYIFLRCNLQNKKRRKDENKEDLRQCYYIWPRLPFPHSKDSMTGKRPGFCSDNIGRRSTLYSLYTGSYSPHSLYSILRSFQISCHYSFLLFYDSTFYSWKNAIRLSFKLKSQNITNIVISTNWARNYSLKPKRKGRFQYGREFARKEHGLRL